MGIHTQLGRRWADPSACTALDRNRSRFWIKGEASEDGVAIGAGMANPGVICVNLSRIAIVLVSAAHPFVRGRVHVQVAHAVDALQEVDVVMPIDAHGDLVGVLAQDGLDLDRIVHGPGSTE